jgi:hypothetical protein
LFTASAQDVIHLRESTGKRLVDFVDTIIRAHGYAHRIRQSNIVTNQRLNLPDGGVDTEVLVGIPTDDVGWCSAPTAWQYKSREYSSITGADLRTEIQKEYVRSLIGRGYGYRICVADDFPPRKKHDWEQLLLHEARSINPDAPEPRVLNASDLATWVRHFPAVVVEFFKRELKDVLTYRAWGANARVQTPQYVLIAGRELVQSDIVDHCVNTTTIDVVFPVQGEAGVGKTRLVLEAIATVPELNSLVLYTHDEQVACNIATAIANDENARALLVADECSVAGKERLRQLLAGHSSRVRVVAIDNFGERVVGLAPQCRLDSLSSPEVLAVLDKNFPHIPSDRRWRYAQYSGGFVRLAADLCRHDDLAKASNGVNEYICARLRDEDSRNALEVISLLTQVGFRDDVAAQLVDLCGLVDRQPAAVAEAADRVKNVSGFIARAGRYYYVTPAAVADVAFRRAWSHWIARNPVGFFSRVPASLLDSFCRRVERSGDAEMRKVASDFFFNWATRLTISQLTDSTIVSRMVTLAKTEPSTFLPIVRRLLEGASNAELGAISGKYSGGWGPRRSLVWLGEHLAIFPEHFADSEAILLRLAIVETEPGIGNNASRVWQEIFQVYLSGTSVPFVERIGHLEKRLFCGIDSVRRLAIVALDGALGRSGGRAVGPPVIAGRIPPSNWQPQNSKDWRECVEAVLRLLSRMAASSDEVLSSAAMNIGIKNLRTLLASGALEQARELFAQTPLTELLRPRLIEQIEKFLEYEGKRLGGSSEDRTFLEAIAEWRRQITPEDFRGRLVSAVGKSPWHDSQIGTKDAWQHELDSLATIFRGDANIRHASFPWLCSVEAQSAVVFGETVGRQDASESLLKEVIDAAVTQQGAGFARGYVLGVLACHPQLAGPLNEILDEVEVSASRVAFELASVGEDQTHAIERTLRMIDAGALPIEFTRMLLFGGYLKRLSPGQIESALSRLEAALLSGNRDAGRIALTIIGYRVSEDAKNDKNALLNDARCRQIVQSVLEATVDDAQTESYWWVQTVTKLKHYDQERALSIAARGLVSDDLPLRHEVVQFLLSEIPDATQPVLDALTSVIFDRQRSWHFFVDHFTPLIAAFPTDVLRDWLEKNGLEAARRIARHLPPPAIDEHGQPVVPALTEFVLEQFADDDAVYDEFCAGVWGGEVMSGDIAAHFEQQAQIAELFLNHRLRRIRGWASSAVPSARANAAEWRRRQEEDFLP